MATGAEIESKRIMTNEQRAFLNALAVGESGGAYDILCGGGRFTDFSGFPQWAGVVGPAGVSHAAGRYQFEPATWSEEVGRLHLADFSPASQDQGAWDLASRVYTNRTGRHLSDDLKASVLDQIAPALKSTWTSLSPASFPDRYTRELAKLAGSPSPVVVKPVSVAPAPQSVPFIQPGHVTTMASAGVAYAVVVSAVWLLSLHGISVPEVVQDGWVVLVTSIGGWFLHSRLATNLGLEEETMK